MGSQLSQNFCPFPPVSAAGEDGLLMVGGCLEPEWLFAAYRRGIFPWPCETRNGTILAWFSPDPRAIVEISSVHLPRRLGRKLRNGQFQFTTNRAFQRVIRACAAPRGEELGTWITPEMIEAYCQLHQLGVAHSVEVWRDNDLVGGVYGVGFGGYFAAESMFHTASDASKAAVIHLAGHLQQQGFTLFDIQQWTPHMGRLGAQEIPRVVFLARLKKALEIDTLFDAS